MNKGELIEKVAEANEMSKAKAKSLTNGFLDVLADVLIEGESVNLSPLGKFEVVERAARKGRNPQTGEEMEIPARNAVKFKPSANLKEMVK